MNPNRGNTLFAKRVQKSEEWIIDDVAEQVIDCARDKIFRNVMQQRSSPVSPIGSHSMSPIAGPVFPAVPVTQAQISRPVNVMSVPQFKDFNARAKPFCRAY